MKLISFLLLNFSFHLWIAYFLCLNIFVPAAHSFIQVKNKLFCGEYISLGHYGYHTGTCFRPLSRPSLMILSSFKGVFRRLLRGHVSWASFPTWWSFNEVFHGQIFRSSFMASFMGIFYGILSGLTFQGIFHEHISQASFISIFCDRPWGVSTFFSFPRGVSTFLFFPRGVSTFPFCPRSVSTFSYFPRGVSTFPV